MNYSLKKILLTEFSIGKWIHSNWLSDTRPKDNVPFNVYWECGPIFYQSMSVLDKLQVWFYSIVIPFIMYKIFEPAILFSIAYWRPIIMSHAKIITLVFSYGFMVSTIIIIIAFMVRSLTKSVSMLSVSDKD